MSFLNRCTYREVYQPKHVYVFTGKCQVTGKDYSVTVPADGLYKYNQGALIQDAFPDLSAEDREFVISGTSPEGWKQIFGPPVDLWRASMEYLVMGLISNNSNITECLNWWNGLPAEEREAVCIAARKAAESVQ